MITLNRVAFTLFGLDIYYYGVMICLAIIACVVVAMVLCRAKKIDTSMPLEIFLAIIPIGILSARLFSVIFEDGLTIKDYFNFRTGGMSIIGAIIGGAIGVLVYKFIKRKSFLYIADIITSVLMLGQSIGRWGNYFNDEIYGAVITNPSHMWFPLGVNIAGTWYQALFFYESVLTLIGFILLVVVYLKTKQTGFCTGLYFIYYGIIRLILESMRQPQYVLKWGSVPVSSLISSFFVFIGASILLGLIIINIIKGRKQKWQKRNTPAEN